MLQHLHIENYALIRQSDIDFADGFVAITGETGAGKSILLGALGLLLGVRADSAVLADKDRKCIVEAEFNIDGLGLQPLFDEADLDYDDRLLVRREILPSTKSRAFVNDTPVQLALLRQLGIRLVDIHSQHQTLTLAGSAFRLQLLDTLAASPNGDCPEASAYLNAFSAYSRLKHDLEELTSAEAQSRKEADYLQFQFNELHEARLVDGEQQELEQESRLLSHAEAVRQGLTDAAELMDNESGESALARLRQAKTALSHIADFHQPSAELSERLNSALIEMDDICSELHTAADSVSFDPGRQQEVDDRLALLYRLEKKHGAASVAELIALRDELDTRLQDVASLDGRIHLLMEQVDSAFALLQTAADKLTACRRKAATSLANNIVPILQELGMKEARFEVQLSPSDTYGTHGHDDVAFLFNANRGGDLRDISKVASGGEMSRLMLAIKSVLTSRTLLPTIVFDEIDTGVSGDIAGAVGRIMRRMAQRMQVIAITHLPQIAAKAGQHLKVFKQLDDGRTVSHIKMLTPEERTSEIAVMLSSDPPTDAALQTARELMLDDSPTPPGKL